MQKEYDKCPLENEKAQNTFNRLGATKISEMKIDDDDRNQKEVKKIEDIDINKIKEWFAYKGNWNYYGECDQNNVPWGIGRLIAKNGSLFIDSYFKNG